MRDLNLLQEFDPESHQHLGKALSIFYAEILSLDDFEVFAINAGKLPSYRASELVVKLPEINVP